MYDQAGDIWKNKKFQNLILPMERNAKTDYKTLESYLWATAPQTPPRCSQKELNKSWWICLQVYGMMGSESAGPWSPGDWPQLHKVWGGHKLITSEELGSATPQGSREKKVRLRKGSLHSKTHWASNWQKWADHFTHSYFLFGNSWTELGQKENCYITGHGMLQSPYRIWWKSINMILA